MDMVQIHIHEAKHLAKARFNKITREKKKKKETL